MRSRLPKRRVSHLRKERMSSYEEMALERKRARVLAQQSPEDPVGYVVGVEGPACSKRLLECIKANKPSLLKILLHRWDPDLEAIQREGAV